MSWRMKVLSPVSYLSNPSWLYEGRNSTKWTPAENKLFENALAMFDKDTPDRWHKVASMVPGKTVLDVMKQYKELEDDVSSIEAGLIPIPGYGTTSPCTLEWGNNHGFEGFKQVCAANGKRSSSTRSSEQEKKKGLPWTEEEHKLFLMGLKKYGKGDWRNISRNYVITRTPTQVASHAQKYFIRQLSGGKDKRRASIHDITVNLEDNPAELTDSKRNPPSEQSTMLLRQLNSAAIDGLPLQWNQPNSPSTTAFNKSCGRMFMSSSCATNPYALKLEVQNLQRNAYVRPQNLVFQMQTHHFPHG